MIKVRKENAELKAGQRLMTKKQEEMTRKLNEVQAENKELKQLITKKK